MTELVTLALVAITLVVLTALFVVATYLVPRTLHYGESPDGAEGHGDSEQEAHDADTPGAGRRAV
ncbi:hypothetical protein [Halomarina ordinaria]|uniref:Cbb3-type cytochrome oxidase assembly protein CcoS n=1 Tax=Halomarina ordinaria TaxID=3033939 RepID=A0ABD5UC26_9EURY|nr:hypothetical protein [Halomarina sp. PSRA2]